jgi:hypothetical protein
LAPPAGGRDVLEVGLSLNGVFGRLTGSALMTAFERAKSELWTTMVGNWG